MKQNGKKEAFRVDDSDLEYTGLQYVCSQFGIVRFIVMSLSLTTFIVNEAIVWCNNVNSRSSCIPPLYQSTYEFYSAVAFGVFLTYAVFFILYIAGIYQKLRCSFRAKILTEIFCTSLSTIFYSFGNAFMISRTDKKIAYIASTVLGCLSTFVLLVHMVLLLARFRYMMCENSERKTYNLENIEIQPHKQVSVNKKEENELQNPPVLQSFLNQRSNTPPIAISSPKFTKKVCNKITKDLNVVQEPNISHLQKDSTPVIPFFTKHNADIHEVPSIQRKKRNEKHVSEEMFNNREMNQNTKRSSIFFADSSFDSSTEDEENETSCDKQSKPVLTKISKVTL